MTSQQFIMITTNFLAELQNKRTAEATQATMAATLAEAKDYAINGVKVAMQALQDKATSDLNVAQAQFDSAKSSAETATNTTGAAEDALKAAILTMQQTGAVEQT